MKKITLLLIAIAAFGCYGQESTGYVILTFISENKGGRHPARTHYWITKVDSINEVGYKVPLFPTYLRTEYSNDCLVRCCNGELIDLLTITTRTDYDYPQEHIEKSEKLLNLVNENKEFLQKVKITWGDQQIRRIIKIYGTPIIGNFCECGIYGTSLRFADGKKKVLIPAGECSLIKNFWKTDIGKFVKFYDFSKVRPQNTL